MRLLIPGLGLLLKSITVCSSELQLSTSSACDISQIMTQLGPQLSSNARIILPSSASWSLLIEGASYPRIDPGYLATVEVATEKDVQETINYANKCAYPFLTITGSHGWPSTLNRLKNGLQINTRKMNSTTLNSDRETATVGGGAMQYEITSSLLAHGKRAVTGLCECVSGIGPLLGGGHSMLQGLHGFAADNLVSARLILANGTAVTASSSQNPDLFWAIRGAGHNFGVVTNYVLKAYDVPAATWTMVTLTFTQDKLEHFFDTWNQMEESHPNPGLLVLNGLMIRNPALDPLNPVLNLQIFYEGTNSAANDYVGAFSVLGPVANSTTGGISWGTDLYHVGGFALTSPVCRKNQSILGYPSSFSRWNPSSMRHGFELFAKTTADPVFNTSIWLLESYGRRGVEAVPKWANAVAPEEREHHLLTSPILWWVGDDQDNQNKAAASGLAMRAAARTGSSSTHAYLNYAAGQEHLPDVYGESPSRLSRLKKLKKAWDPKNSFGFYMPL